MCSKDKRICPYCGKPLILVGEVLGDKYHEKKIGQKHTTESLYVDTFEKDKIWTNGVDMFCSNCGVKVDLHDNPFISARVISFFTTIPLLTASVVAAMLGYNIIFWTLLMNFLFVIILFLHAAVRCLRIKKYKSNFVFSTNKVLPIYDPEKYLPISPNIRLSMSAEKLQHTSAKKFLLSKNMFSSEIASLNAFLYLMNVELQKSVYIMDFRFCGTYNDVRKYIQYLKSVSDNEDFLIPIRFEGILIGNANIQKIYELTPTPPNKDENA